ncbi:MAG: HvfA family oxazolone/thioamide-modified RiPP metallophore [Gammaproteobacteria bacterium]
MSSRVLRKPVALAIGAALATSLAAAGAAQASSFAVNALGSGYMLAAGEPGGDDKAKEGKCGEGKCGSDKAKEGKCGEGKCGADKAKEGKCGEGKCGGDQTPAEEKPKT